MNLFRWDKVGIWALLLFLPAPIIIVIAASFSEVGYIRFPPGARSLRWYEEFLSDPRWMEGFMTSLQLAVAAAIFSTVTAFLATYIITRNDGWFFR